MINPEPTVTRLTVQTKRRFYMLYCVAAGIYDYVLGYVSMRMVPAIIRP